MYPKLAACCHTLSVVRLRRQSGSSRLERDCFDVDLQLDITEDRDVVSYAWHSYDSTLSKDSQKDEQKGHSVNWPK